MKILHLIDSCLPGGLLSWRVEKSAISAANNGHDLFFGGLATHTNRNKTFIKTYEINWTPHARRGFPYDWHCVKKQVSKVLIEVRPDIVHANNIFSAKMISEFDVPFVYDDHEYWSSYVKILVQPYGAEKKSVMKRLAMCRYPKRILRSLAIRFLDYNYLRNVSNWQKDIVSFVPTIVTTDKVAEEIRKTSNPEKVFTVPNFPSMMEVKDFEKPSFHSTLSSVFAGLGSI